MLRSSALRAASSIPNRSFRTTLSETRMKFPVDDFQSIDGIYRRPKAITNNKPVRVSILVNN